MKPKQPPGPAMTLGNMRFRFIFFTLLIFSSSASAENCFTVDDDENRPVATLSGRITSAVRFSVQLRKSEGRAAGGPYLVLDTPLSVLSGSRCTEWSAIPVFMKPENRLQSGKIDTLLYWVN